jgi:hypothetical protein
MTRRYNFYFDDHEYVGEILYLAKGYVSMTFSFSKRGFFFAFA